MWREKKEGTSRYWLNHDMNAFCEGTNKQELVIKGPYNIMYYPKLSFRSNGIVNATIIVSGRATVPEYVSEHLLWENILDSMVQSFGKQCCENATQMLRENSEYYYYAEINFVVKDISTTIV